MSFLPSTELYLAFLAAAIALNLTPGPDMAFVAAQSSARGKRAGAAAALGVSTGTLVHAVLVAAGLSVLLKTSAIAFFIVKAAGAAYLLFLAYKMTFGYKPAAPNRDPNRSAPPAKASSPLGAFWQGVLCNVLNPKVAIFMMALLPQFVSTDAGSAAGQMLFLGATLALTGGFTNVAVALAAGALIARAGRNLKAARIGRWAVGGLFAALALRLAFATRL